MTQESQSALFTPVIDCKGVYDASCGAPLPETRWINRTIDSFNYVDLVGSGQINDQIRLSLSTNDVFGEDPPIVGNEAGSTTFNGGNTFPSHYDVLGSVYTVGFNAQF